MPTTISKSPIDRISLSLASEIAHFKRLIQKNNEELISRFKASEPIVNLLVAKASFVDELMITCWKKFLGPLADKLALIAVGGYGRRELFPHSDIDLLILLDGNDPSPYQQALSELFSFLWDIGLKPGQSVRTLPECIAAAADDQTIMTSLMESRLMYGEEKLFDAMKGATAPDKFWPSNEFFDVKMEEQQHRHSKYHDTAYNLEPNVKEGPGGLRDIQIIAWVIKRHYNAPTLYELVEHGCLTEAEYAELMAAQQFLWCIRFALHTLTGRCEDRLLFDYQKDLAEQFGYNDPEGYQSVEQFMQTYFCTVMGLERLNEMLLQLFREGFLHHSQEFEVKPITPFFQSFGGYIEVSHQNVFQERPQALLEIFLLLQQNTSLKGIRATTIRLIRQNLHRIDDDFRNDKSACNLFMDILRQPTGITHQLRRMSRYGILAAYLPAFANIVGRMQYDLFHIYTVDEHTLFTVRNIRRFALDKHNDELPFCNDIFMLIRKPELLYIAALFHDIAKGRKGDHSELGEEIAREFCVRHDLQDHDTRLVVWQVRHHLIMSMTAQRKDIGDPEIVHEFASKVGSEEYLNHLYLLTVADIRATNPALWNSWKDALLQELYVAAHNALRRGLQRPIGQHDKIRESQQDARKLLHRLGLGDAEIDKVWSTIGDDYFLRYTADECAWHTVAIAACSDRDLPLVLLRPQTQRGSAEVFLYTKENQHIFSESTAALDQMGLTILDARIITSSDGYILNSYLVLEESGEPIADLRRQLQICNSLRQRILEPAGKPFKVARRQARQAKHFPIPTRLDFLPDPQNRYTILELIATDRPGLLSKVGQAFRKQKIRVHDARITTIGHRVEDIFYITNQASKPLADDELKEQLKDEIIRMFDEEG
ncbi:MAG: [protein-PII] uridylyltransferase [Pseudomonadota bacterium]